MRWTRAVLIFVVGTVVSTIVANLSSFSTQICSVSFALVVIIKESKKTIDIFFVSFLIGVMEDLIEGTALGTNFLLFFVPLFIISVVVRNIEQNAILDLMVFSFLSISILILKVLYSTVFSVTEPAIISLSGWMKHNILPIMILYSILYMLYKFMLGKSDRVP